MASANQRHNNDTPLRIANRAAWQIADSYVSVVDGYDKPAWRKALMEHMADTEPIADQIIRETAVEAIYGDVIEDAIHHFKASDETVPEAAKTKRAIQKFRNFVKQSALLVSVPSTGNRVHAKRYRDCTPAELDAAAVLCEHKAAPYQRQAKFLHESAAQARLAGLADSDPLSNLLAV
jgi:predicted amidophosphoribosyltransferase